MSLSSPVAVRPAGGTAHVHSGRFRAWATAADEGETEWAVHRSAAAKVACWSLVAIVVVGAYLGRANLSPDLLTSTLLTVANATALGLAIASLRRARFAPITLASILGVLLVGGVFQIYLLSYNFPRNQAFLIDQLPFHRWVGSSDISQVYGLLTVAFVVFCLMVAVLSAIPIRPTIGRTSDLTDFGRLTTLLVWATIGYIGFTLISQFFGIGQAALYNKPLPFRLVAITIFYQRNFFPALMLLGIWAYDRRQPKLTYLCLIGMAMVVANLSFDGSRGSIPRSGLPIVFLWLLTGRFTRFRKSLVVAAFVAYLVLAPVIASLRTARVRETVGIVRPAAAKPSPLSAESLNYELGHFVFRVGGSTSLMFAMHRQDDLSLGGLTKVYRPSGLTSYFTNDVMGIRRSALVATSQAPTLLGLGTLVGGVRGMLLVLVLTVLAFDMAARWVARTLRTWPVATALLATGAVSFVSEGTPILMYKTFLTIAVIEVIYRVASPRVARSGLVRHQQEPVTIRPSNV